MNSRTQASSLNLRNRNIQLPSKATSKHCSKKVLKNQDYRGKPVEKKTPKVTQKCERVVVWKSTRGRTEEKIWSCEEEQRLFALHEKLGNRWTIISREFANKSDNDVKNHIFSRFRLGVRRINKIAAVGPAHLRPLKMSIISKIVTICDSRFTSDSTVQSTLVDTAVRLKQSLLGFLYEYPSAQTTPKVHKLIEDLHDFSEQFIKVTKNNQNGSDCEDQFFPDLQENISHQMEPSMDIQKENESQPTKVQDQFFDTDSQNERQQAFDVQNLLQELSAVDLPKASQVAILTPEFNSPIYVGNPFALHCAESLLPPIHNEQAYQYDANEKEFEAYGLFDFSI